MGKQWAKQQLHKNLLASSLGKVFKGIGKNRQTLITSFVVAILLAMLIPVIMMYISKQNLKTMDAFVQASKLYDDKKYNESLQSLQKLLPTSRSSKLSAKILFYIGNSQYHLGKAADSITTYKTFVREYPDDILIDMAYESLGISYENMKDFANALSTYREFIKNNPSSFLTPKFYLNIGRCYKAQNNPHEEQKAYDEALSNYPDSEWLLEIKEKASEEKEQENENTIPEKESK